MSEPFQAPNPKVVWRDVGEMQIWLQAFSLFAQKPNNDLNAAIAIADTFLDECRNRTPAQLIAVPDNAHSMMPQKP